MNKRRKPRPSMPEWFWWGQDRCWFCKDRNNCNQCKATLYKSAAEKFNIYHLAVRDRATSYDRYASKIKASFGQYLDKDHLITVSLDNIANTIVDIVCNSGTGVVAATVENTNTNGEISW